MKLRNFTKKDFEVAVGFVHQGVLKNPSKKSYPLIVNADPALLRRELEKCAAGNSDAELLGCWSEDDELCGVMSFFKYEDGQGLQTTCLYTEKNDREVIGLFANYLKAKFPGMFFYVGVESTYTSAIEALNRELFFVLEDSLTFRQVITAESSSGYKKHDDVKRIGSENLEEYLAFHSKCFDDEIYWTSDRVRESLDGSEMFALYEGEVIKGILYARKFDGPEVEVFAVHADSKDDAVKLYETAFVSLRENVCGFKCLISFIETSEVVLMEAVKELQFEQVSHYMNLTFNN